MENKVLDWYKEYLPNCSNRMMEYGHTDADELQFYKDNFEETLAYYHNRMLERHYTRPIEEYIPLKEV
jgi:hypothetical protein